jgi:hypothetical protein
MIADVGTDVGNEKRSVERGGEKELPRPRR